MPRPGDGGKTCTDPGALALVFADLAGQHEQLWRVSAELDGALAGVRTTMAKARELLQDSPEVATVPWAVPAPPLSPPATGAQELGAVTSEWRRGLVEAAPPLKAPKGVAAVELTGGADGGTSSPPRGCSAGSAWEDLPKSESRSWQDRAEAGAGSVKDEEAEHKVVFRLRARLGVRGLQDSITAQQVHMAVTSLGLVRYSLADLEEWLSQVRSFDKAQRPHALPSLGGLTGPTVKVRPSVLRALKLGQSSSDRNIQTDMPFKDFAQVLLDEESIHLAAPRFADITQTIREVLLSGDANRLISQLAHVTVDEVAAPQERPDLWAVIEPVVGFVIVLNGISIGAQTDDPGGKAWAWANLAFSIFFVIEIGLRVWLSGAKHFLVGPDRWWNLFDSFLIFTSLLDVICEATDLAFAGDAPISVMRILRLTRLMRLIRIFRLRYLRELALMVRGLLGGLYTLFWAVVLLFFTLYVMAILVTSTIGMSSDPVPEVHRDELFATVPRSTLTAFRCFMGDCSTSDGKPIVLLLSEKHGPLFILGYFASMVFVCFGLFNLIISVYVENTLTAARMEGEKSRAQRQHESVRVARLVRQLLKKFIAAQRVLEGRQTSEVDQVELQHSLHCSAFDDVGEASAPISKELFLSTIQDSSVQRLLDELDIPPGRAGLFDTLDADGSGGLQLEELITGLLQIRGEPRKSDVVGTLLAVRKVQEMLRTQASLLADLDERLEGHERCKRAP